MEINPDLPPVEDEEMGVMGLTQVDPSPVEDTPMEFREKGYFPEQERPEKETEDTSFAWLISAIFSVASFCPAHCGDRGAISDSNRDVLS